MGTKRTTLTRIYNSDLQIIKQTTGKKFTSADIIHFYLNNKGGKH